MELLLLLSVLFIFAYNIHKFHDRKIVTIQYNNKDIQKTPIYSGRDASKGQVDLFSITVPLELHMQRKVRKRKNT